MKVEDTEGQTPLKYEKGYALGMKGAKTADDQPEPLYLNNHLKFKILYHNEDDASIGSRIVGFEVEPMRSASAVQRCGRSLTHSSFARFSLPLLLLSPVIAELRARLPYPLPRTAEHCRPVPCCGNSCTIGIMVSGVGSSLMGVHCQH